MTVIRTPQTGTQWNFSSRKIWPRMRATTRPRRARHSKPGWLAPTTAAFHRRTFGVDGTTGTAAEWDTTTAQEHHLLAGEEDPGREDPERAEEVSLAAAALAMEHLHLTPAGRTLAALGAVDMATVWVTAS